jgi:hypothetical protein
MGGCGSNFDDNDAQPGRFSRGQRGTTRFFDTTRVTKRNLLAGFLAQP